MTDQYLNSLLGEREEILLVTRQHGFVLLRAIMVEIFLSLVIITLVVVMRTLFVPDDRILLGLLVLIPPVISLFIDVANWFTRKYVITNRRVIHVYGIYNKNVIDSSLEKVNDVKMVQSFLGRAFDFGDVEIMTASELGVNQFRMIGRPVRFKIAMLNAKERLESGMSTSATRKPMSATEMIVQLDMLRQQGVLTEEEFAVKKAELLKKI